MKHFAHAAHSRASRYNLSALLWAAIVLQAGFAIAAADPRQCIMEAGSAVEKSDVAAFEKQVDVDAILEQALNLFVRRAQDPEAAKDLPPMVALLFTQAASKEGNVRSLLLNETRAFVLNGISSGAFAGRKPSGNTRSGHCFPCLSTRGGEVHLLPNRDSYGTHGEESGAAQRVFGDVFRAGPDTGAGRE